MKLHRNFNDYYDGALSMFMDNELPFYDRTKGDARYLESDVKNMFPSINIGVHGDHSFVLGMVSGLIVVAGKGYPYNTVSKHIKSENGSLHNTVEEVHYFDYDEFLANSDSRQHIPTWGHGKNREAFELLKKFNFNDLHQLLEVPMFSCKFGWDYMAQKNQIKFNRSPKLKDDFGFQKVLEPYQLAQEINMYLNNTMVSDTKVKVPVGSDEVIAASKGFDKWSFRTPPGGKKRNKKEKES